MLRGGGVGALASATTLNIPGVAIGKFGIYNLPVRYLGRAGVLAIGTPPGRLDPLKVDF